MEIYERDKMETVESDHLIVAEMLMISSAIEEVAHEYKINIPTLTTLSVDKVRERVGKLPKSKLRKLLDDSIEMYLALESRLVKNAY